MEKLEILISLFSSYSGSQPQRFKPLLKALSCAIHCDAAAILIVEGESSKIVSCLGLTSDVLGKRFWFKDHPRLDVIRHSTEPVIFPSDSSLPDPYDGYFAFNGSCTIRVHSCLGIPLLVDDTLLGLMTADAITDDAFRDVDVPFVKAIAALACSEIYTANLVRALESTSEKMCLVAQDLVKGAHLQKGDNIVGDSKEIKRLRREITLIARSDFSVLITGETGAGKEMVARAIHASSKRSEQPLLYLNCANLPNTLVETELFGHVRGAFTGAIGNRAGKLELADGGTLLFDEIGEIPFNVQPKFLRFLQTGEVQRVGSNTINKIDVRVLAATNRELEKEVKKGRFRSDLFHRLNVYPIHVPALREHSDDIPILAGYVAESIQRRLGVGEIHFRNDTFELLKSYNWPGNVRELENVIARSVIRASQEAQSGDMIIVTPQHLGIEQSILEIAPTQASSLSFLSPKGNKPLRSMVDDFQRELIRSVVENNRDNWSAAAKELGVNRGNLYKLAVRLGLKSK
jgi:anaerobic nitric oxide reductase transcription regulator